MQIRSANQNQTFLVLSPIDRLGQFPIHVTMIRRQRRIIESPVEQVIVGGIAIPLIDGEVDRDLHPMPLSLVIAEHGRLAVRQEWEGTGAKGHSEVITA